MSFNKYTLQTAVRKTNLETWFIYAKDCQLSYAATLVKASYAVQWSEDAIIDCFHKIHVRKLQLYRIIIIVGEDGCPQSKKGGKCQESINQVPHLTQDTTWESDKTQLNITNKCQEVSPFPAGDHKAIVHRCESMTNTRHK